MIHVVLLTRSSSTDLRYHQESFSLQVIRRYVISKYDHLPPLRLSGAPTGQQISRTSDLSVIGGEEERGRREGVREF